MRRLAKQIINAALGKAGLRVIDARWGPRGFGASFKKLRAMGIEPRQIVDVGAASGQWTRECLEIFPASRYLLIDPLEENRPALEQLAGEHRNIRLWHGALGSKAGTLTMHVHGDQSSFLTSEYAGSSARSVAVRTMDSFLGTQEMEAPSLIKADVQGYELEVLGGAEQCLGAAEYVLLEVSFRKVYADCPLAHEVIAFMGGRGFRIYDICAYSQRARDGELFQSDILFARDGAKVFEFEGYR